MPLYNHDPNVIKADFGTGDGEVEIHIWPMSLEEMEKIELAAKKSNVSVLVTALIVRARNADRSKMFTIGDEQRIRRKFDSEAVLRVNIAINAGDSEGGTSDAEK